jgi:hypothetical protein
MASVTCFDDLSPELILWIFDFLSPADRYKSFFDINSRLRSLVKKYTKLSRKGLDADILRYSTLHSWYKHLSFDNGGDLYFIVPAQGQQPRYSFDPRITDADGLHWWFIYERGAKHIKNENIRAIVTRYPFRLNPFFYHSESHSSGESGKERRFYGGDIIKMLCKFQLGDWLKINYPDYDKVNLLLPYSSWDDDVPDFVPVFDGEWLKATTAIQKAAAQIWNELKELNDVNPLQMILE